MKLSRTPIFLACLVALLGAAHAGVGLFWQDGGSPFTFTILHGTTVEICGKWCCSSET